MSLATNVTGVILAGGQSRRMGFNKAEAAIHGRPMLRRMIDKLSGVTPTILLSTGFNTYSGLEWPQIIDEYPDCGALGGIYSALKISGTSLNLVLSCDMPMVSASLLNYLIERAEEKGALITAPVDQDGQLQLLCAVYHKDIIPVMEQQIKAGTLKMKALAAIVPMENVKISKGHPLYNEYAFKNVNTPDALREILRLWKDH